METAEKIAVLEQEILEKKKELVTLRKELPHLEVENFIFDGRDGRISLLELFGDKKDMVAINNMGRECAHCTLWADGFNGSVPELESRAAFILVSPDSVHIVRAFALARGWRFKWASDPDRKFSKALGLIGESGVWPAAIGLRREGDRIIRVAQAELGEGDDYCSTWHLFDLLADGSNGWEPNYRLNV